MRNIAILLTLAILVAPASAMARPGGGGGGRDFGGGGRGMARPAPAARPSGGGFNLSNDVRRPQPQRPPQNVQRPNNGGNFNRPNNGNNNVNRPNNGNNNGNRPNNGNNNNGNRPNNGNNNNGNRPNNGNNNVNRPNNGNNNNGNRNNINNGNRNNVNISGNTVNRTVVNNPVYTGGAWGWNHGVAWAPAPYYWGGGFWGAMAISATSAAIYGSIVANGHSYTSYQVQPSSPGATFLTNYSLTQVQCGPSGLVVVYGPQNSVICANPNNYVAAGTYQLNTDTLTLSSI